MTGLSEPFALIRTLPFALSLSKGRSSLSTPVRQKVQPFDKLRANGLGSVVI